MDPGPGSLLCDNGATACIAARGWAFCIFRLPGIGQHLRGGDNVKLRGVGRGRVYLQFPYGTHVRWLSAPGLNLFTGKKRGPELPPSHKDQGFLLQAWNGNSS